MSSSPRSRETGQRRHRLGALRRRRITAAVRPYRTEGCDEPGSAHGRFTRAIKQRSLFAAETALRELGTPSLLDALDYLELLAETKVEKLPGAALRWHGRFELEATTLTIAESQLALSALGALRAGDREAATCSGGCCGVCDRRALRPAALNIHHANRRFRSPGLTLIA